MDQHQRDLKHLEIFSGFDFLNGGFLITYFISRYLNGFFNIKLIPRTRLDPYLGKTLTNRVCPKAYVMCSNFHSTLRILLPTYNYLPLFMSKLCADNPFDKRKQVIDRMWFLNEFTFATYQISGGIQMRAICFLQGYIRTLFWFRTQMSFKRLIIKG